jgi:hypothetical protein
MARKAFVFTCLSLLLLAAAGAVPPQGGDSPFEEIRRAAEREYAEKSYSRAHSLYESALKLELTPAQRRWLTFRLADTAWRADAAAPNPDPTVRDAARKTLEELATSTENDLVRAEASESLGDYYAFHPRHGNVSEGMRWYQSALDYWAGSEDIPVARKRYLGMVWRIADAHPWAIPRDVLVNAIQIAETPNDRARARMLLAQQLLGDGSAASRERALELYEEVIALGRNTRWYGEALYHYASNTTDYARALELYRRLLNEFAAGETPYRDEARNAIAEITRPAVTVMIGQTFLPKSEQEIVLAWRNVKQIELTLHAIDLTRDATLGDNAQWLDTIPLANAAVARRWTYDTQDDDRHRPGQTIIPMSPRVDPGAYVLVARAGNVSNRALFLVSDAHLLIHYSGDRMDVFVSDVETGEPLPNARVHLSGIAPNERSRNGRPFALDATTNADGLATLKLRDHGQVLVTANASAAKQAYHQTHVWIPDRHVDTAWRIYAFTDRPAYRPNETVQWKAIARVRDNEQWRTPAGAALEYDIMSPRGEKVATGTAKLTAYGSLWGELALTPAMALGQYTIIFRDGRNHVGNAALFRLEEYKLPEFSVSVSTPEGKQYRLGETIEAAIDATYYFGGPVANAEVEVVVYQSPFHRYWYPWRVLHWYWNDSYIHQPSEVMSRQTLRTDANGRAIVRIPTSRDANDTSYRIEARVVDASRREVRGEGSVRVMRQRYSVMAVPEHYIHRPGEPATVRFRAVDANDKPVQTTGTVEVIRRRWRNRTYVEEIVHTTKLTTDARGEATFTFTPKSTGYYLVRWTSIDGDENRERDKVIAETTIWVADPKTTDLGYHHASGIDIIVDKEAMRAGETATALLVAPVSGRWIVLTTSGDRIMDTRVVRMEGTAKVVQLPLSDQHVPNFFLTASSVFERQIATTMEQIIVPPVEHFLNVEVRSDREEYGPREAGTLTITTRDAANKPVSAEVAVAVSDEAVTAIQRDESGDPRQFFFSELRHGAVQVTGSLHSQQYVILKEEELREREEQQRVRRREAGFADGSGAGVAYDTAAVPEAIMVTAQASKMTAPPPPAPAAPPSAPVATVAAEAPASGIEVQVRSDFRSTAFWKPDVITDANGTATVKVQFPEALTTWRATARAATMGSAFGMASSTARTNLPLLVRLQAPRFFVAGDRVTVSAVINNNTDQPMTVTPELYAEGVSGGEASAPLVVPPHGDARADWVVVADKAGPAKLRVTARGAQLGDSMEKTFVVYEHGIDKLVARSGKMRGDETLVRLELPAQRRATDLVVRVQPSLAAALLDALPYLLEFPYGCTEQTMSRFLPAAVLAKTTGKKPANLDAVINAGLQRLYATQHGSGAWGWFEEGPDDEWMTAYVVWGLSIARDAGVKVDHGVLNRAGEWLSRRLVSNRGRYNELAWMLHALSAWRGKFPAEIERRAFDDVWENRERLTAYGRALFALTAHRYGEVERARVLVRNLEDGVQLERGDDAAETMATAHWGASGFWWRWYEGPIETTAFALQALVTIDPQHRLVEPAMNWLVKNRRGAQWTNTRDTAIAILALNDYIARTDELQGDAAYELTVNGRVIATQSGDGRFSIDPAILRDTTQEIRIRRTSGTGPLYFATEARFVSLEEPVTKAGNELFVKRDYFRLDPRPTLLKGVRYEPIPLRDGASIASGERIEVVLTIDVKNDYEYLVFEDLKPGGFEAVALQSGGTLHATSAKTGRTAWVYQELRDRKVAHFVDKLPQGVWEIRYTLRAETPGTFHALPLLGWAMYVPDIRGNSDEVRVTVTE